MRQISGTHAAIYTTLVLVIIRLVIDTAGVGIDSAIRIYPVLLGLLIASFLGLRAQRMTIQTESPQEFKDLTFIMEIRAAMRPPAILSLLYCLFLVVFYTYINPTLFIKEVENRKAEYEIAFAENNISPEEATQVLDNFTTFTDFVFSPINWATLTLFGLIFLSAFYSFLLAVIARKFPQFTNI